MRKSIKKIWHRAHFKLYRFFLSTIGFTKDGTSRNLFKLFRAAIYATVLVFIINLFSLGTSSFGEWGDFFGGVLNPILTFFTFMGLLITIILQQAELKESRKEFKRSADALNEQSQNLKQERFETTFFNLVSSLNASINELEVDVLANKHVDEKEIVKGKKVFQFYHEELLDRIKQYDHDEKDVDRRVERGVDSFFFHYNMEIEHYFKQIKLILQFIELSEIENKQLFFNLLSGQLSLYEKGLIFHCAFPDDEFKNLVDKYSLLSGLILKHFTYDPRIFNPYTSVKY